MQGAPTRVGVVGYGYWGAHHVRVLSSLPNVHVSLAESDRHRLQEARSQYPRIACSDRIEDLLDGLDCVVVATPPEQHAAVAALSLSAGKYTLVEKPFTVTVDQAETLLALAQKHNSRLMVGHTYIYHQALDALKVMIVEGQLGDIIYIDSARLALGKYRQDVNVIWDLAPHDLSIFSFLLDQIPYAVTAWEHRSRGASQSDLAYISLEYENNVRAFANVSWISPDRARRVTVVGSSKMATYDYLSQASPLRIYDSSVDFGLSRQGDSSTATFQVSYRNGDITVPDIDFNEPLVAQDSHFIECVRTGKASRTPGEHGLQVVKILAAIDESCRTGLRVELNGMGRQ